MGVGLPSDGSSEDAYLIENMKPSKEMDLFGYCLDISGQAVQHYTAFNDIKATKKKFSNSKKLPKELRHV
jgi:hypothetical protein